MPDIRILPQNVANVIAAGEVVQRPASVVKELVENAVDAGAAKISVVVTDAGRTLIQVIDNGCGMTPDQAVICFQRHATSKISCAADLDSIDTFGFRGEALASIAAVSQVILKTRTPQAEVATEVTIGGTLAGTDGDTPCADDVPVQDVTAVAAPVGTSFAIRNIFYNTPARRKFLKSDAAEMKAILQEVIRVALGHTDIVFTLTSDGREILHLDRTPTLKYRIRDIFGAGVADSLLTVSADTTAATVSGFTADPESARKSGSEQYFFVNGRYFRSPYLHKAVMKAYEEMLPQGYAPNYFIFIETDPHKVDVNVHPTKTEIKFEDDNVLFTILMAAVREALGRNVFSRSIDFEAAELPQLHNVAPSFGEYRPVSEPSLGGNDSFNPFDGDGFPNETLWNEEPARLFEKEEPERVPAVKEDSSPLVCGKYVITRTDSGFIVVNAVRALERILFEKFLKQLTGSEAAVAAALFPVEVEIGADNMPLLEHNCTLLQGLGFEFAPFSAASIVVTALPEGVSQDRMDVSALVYEIITMLGDEQASIAGALYSSLAGKLAKSAAARTALPTTGARARELLDHLYQCETPEFTPHGHRCVLLLNGESIEKLMK